MPRNVGTLTKRRVAARAKWRCRACKILVDEFYEIDHIKPLAGGGSNAIANLQLLCNACHATKSRDEAIANEQWLSIVCCGRCGRNTSKYWHHYCHMPKPSVQPIPSAARGQTGKTIRANTGVRGDAQHPRKKARPEVILTEGEEVSEDAERCTY